MQLYILEAYFRRGIIFQHKCFTLTKIQKKKRGGSLNTSKNVKYSNKKNTLQKTCVCSLLRPDQPLLRLEDFQDWFFSLCPGGLLYLLLIRRKGRMWSCVYLVTLSMVQFSTTQLLLCYNVQNSSFRTAHCSAGSLSWAGDTLNFTRKVRCSVLIPQLI